MEQLSQIVDKNAALERLDQDEELYQEILALFLDDYPEQIHSLKNAIGAGDIETSHRIAHSMKSAAGNVGAVAVSMVARDMESAAKDGNAARVKLLFADLENELELLQNYLQKISAQ